MPQFLSVDDFAAGSAGQIPVRTAGATVDLANSSGRLISYIFSDTSVGRDNHVIAANAWILDQFLRNPVFLWAHDQDAPPIGKVIDIETRAGRLIGTVEYAERDIYPFADTIFQMTKAGFINATSTSWIPREWKFSADRSRPGGVDFSKVELLEISQVPVPALPTALVTARAQGIDTGPIFEWAERMLDASHLAVLPREELELLRREAKMPSPAKLKIEETLPEPAPVRTVKLNKRGLGHVSWLAYLLSDLGCLQESAEWEAAIEEDGSQVPAQMLEALKSLGAVLIAMTQEEVNELLAGDDEDDAIGDTIEMAAGDNLKRSAIAALSMLDEGAMSAVTAAMRLHLRGEKVTFTTGGPITALARAGKVLSEENERRLREAHGHMEKAIDMVRSVVDKNKNEDEDEPADDTNDDDENARALRARKARARSLKLKAVVA